MSTYVDLNPPGSQVYNKDQVYPEYLVLYERLHGTRPPEPPPKDLPFLLELPLYWKNVGKNPRIQETSSKLRM